jgi:hypothetical protein
MAPTAMRHDRGRTVPSLKRVGLMICHAAGEQPPPSPSPPPLDPTPDTPTKKDLFKEALDAFTKDPEGNAMSMESILGKSTLDKARAVWGEAQVRGEERHQ